MSNCQITSKCITRLTDTLDVTGTISIAFCTIHAVTFCSNHAVVFVYHLTDQSYFHVLICVKQDSGFILQTITI